MTTVGRVDFEMGLDRTGLRRGLNKAEKDVKRSASGMRTALASVGGALVIGGAIRQLAEFEQAMSTVAAVTGATGEQLKSMTALAKKMALETRFSAKEASEGMLALARAGLTVEQTMEALPHTLQLAQAGALQLGDAADIVTNVLSGMRLEVDDLQRVGDVLTKVANSSNTNVQELGQAFSYAAPIANQFGLSVEDTAAALGLFSNNGIKADRAGTALNNVLARLTNRTQKGEKILAKYNLTYEKLDVSTRGLVPVLEELEEKNISVADSMALFAIRGSAGGNILAKQKKSFLDLAKAAREAEGTMAKTSEIMDDNLNGALLRLNSAAQGLIIELGEDKGLGKVVDALAGALRFAADNADTFGMIAATLALSTLPALANAARAVLVALGPMGAAIAAAGLAATAFIKLTDEMNKVGDTGKDMNEILAETNRLLGETDNIMSGDPFKLLGESADEAKDAVGRLANTLKVLYGNEFIKAAVDQQALVDDLRKTYEEAARAAERGTGSTKISTFGARTTTFDGVATDEQVKAARNALIALTAAENQLTRLQEAGAQMAATQINDVWNPTKDAVEETDDAVTNLANNIDTIKTSLGGFSEDVLGDGLSARVSAPQSTPIADIDQQRGIEAEQEKQQLVADTEAAAEASKEAFRRTFKDAFKTAVIDGDVGTAIKTVFADRAAAGLENALDKVADAILDAFSGIDFGGIFGGGGGGLGGLFGGLLGGSKAAASGGSVRAGQKYRVNELGSETFVPFKDGTIIPNKLPTGKASQSKMQGQSITVAPVVNIQGDATKATADLINDRMKSLPDIIDARLGDRRRRGAF